MVALVLALGSIMTALDMTVVNVALNRLALEFTAPLALVQWVVTGYSLALGAIIPVTAWLVGRVGARRLYLTAIAVFAAGSALAALAWNIGSLIAFRAVQGLGGGALLPVGMTILIRAAGPDRLGRLMSILGLAVLVGPLAGPVAGGWLVDAVSWRWMFLVNLPIGVAVLVLAGRVFPPDPATPDRRPLDLLGMLLLSPGLVALVLGLTVGGERHDFGAPAAFGPIAVGVALVVGFVLRAVTARHPLLDPRPFRTRSFAAGTGTLAAFACGYFGSMLLVPLYFQVVRGESATLAGVHGVPLALASGTAMQVIGRITDRVPAGRIVPFGVLVAGSGFTLLATQLGPTTPYWLLAVALLLVGAGGGMTMMPTMTAAARDLPGELAPAASTTLNLVHTTAGAVGTAVVSVLRAGNLAGPTGGGGIQAARGAAPDAVAAAFRHTYLMPLVLLAVALLAALALPRAAHRPAAPARAEALAR